MKDYLQVGFRRISDPIASKEGGGKIVFRLIQDDPEDKHLREASICVDRENKRYINLKLLLTGWEDVGIESRWECFDQVFTVARDTVLPAHQLATCFCGAEEEGAIMEMEFKKGIHQMDSRTYGDETVVKKDAEGHLYLSCRAYLD